MSYGSVHVEVVNIQNADDNLIVHELRLTNREVRIDHVVSFANSVIKSAISK